MAWTNSIFQETVEKDGKTYYNCVFTHSGCFRKECPYIDCRNCTVPLLFPEEARAIINSKRRD